jgi:hypothetical protein
VRAPGKGAREKRHALVVKLDVGAQVVAVVAAPDFGRLEPGRLVVLEDQMLVIFFSSSAESERTGASWRSASTTIGGTASSRSNILDSR